jgi:serine/threonine protein kinase, bacterial
VDKRTRVAIGAEPLPGYKLVQLRGKGAFAEVWEAVKENGESVALKFISSDKTATTVKEVKSLQAIQRLRHAHLLRIENVSSVPGFIVIAMELADCSLLDLLDAYQTEFKTLIPVDELAAYMAQVAAGLDFLNARRHLHEGRKVGFQHCDVKPSNILMVGKTIKLADFGLSAPTAGLTNPYSKSGTLEFAAPEIHRGMLSEKSDQFSLAVSWYYLRTATFPYPLPPEGFGRRYSYSRPAPDLGLVTRSERKILERALDGEPEHRWESCEVLIRELHYAWMYSTGTGMSSSSIFVSSNLSTIR